MESAPSTSNGTVVVTLLDEDVEGATLEEPLDTKTVPQLRWWLLCHGIKAPKSEKKPALLERYVKIYLLGNSTFSIGIVL